MQNKVIGIIGAMDCEIELLENFLEKSKRVQAGKFYIVEGEINNHKVIIAKCGVGKTNAACCTQFLVDKFSPDYIINTGVAGGICDNLSVGDVVIAADLVHHDFDVSVLGYAKGYMCTGNNPNKPTIFSSDEKLIKIFEKSATSVISSQNIHKGRIASGDIFVGNIDRKVEIKELFNAIAVEMEGASVAQAAYMNEIPFVVVRAISDLADGTATESQSDFENKTAKITSHIIKEFLQTI
ncbi:MAG: 5'-methylthioadenosine/adenosylhomocysteine nucleosidase [Candidatus Gastranaerophilaceae bacterium]